MSDLQNGRQILLVSEQLGGNAVPVPPELYGTVK